MADIKQDEAWNRLETAAGQIAGRKQTNPISTCC